MKLSIEILETYAYHGIYPSIWLRTLRKTIAYSVLSDPHVRLYSRQTDYEALRHEDQNNYYAMRVRRLGTSGTRLFSELGCLLVVKIRDCGSTEKIMKPFLLKLNQHLLPHPLESGPTCLFTYPPSSGHLLIAVTTID
jgi:hypothetical protein